LYAHHRHPVTSSPYPLRSQILTMRLIPKLLPQRQRLSVNNHCVRLSLLQGVTGQRSALLLCTCGRCSDRRQMHLTIHHHLHQFSFRYFDHSPNGPTRYPFLVLTARLSSSRSGRTPPLTQLQNLRPLYAEPV
ncbi:hypothetical protein E4U43_006085, partial [Claviceps pusilla]